MSRFNAFFMARKHAAFWVMCVFFAISTAYGLTALLWRPDWNFWLILIPGALCLYFRLLHAKATYDPTRDRISGEYIPRNRRGR